jgi:hypothetical protein
MPTDIVMGPDLALTVFDQEEGKASLGDTQEITNFGESCLV